MNILLAVKHQQLDEHNARTMKRIEAETSTSPTASAKGATAGGDERRLRGIPALSRGVGGAINGTRPGDTLR